MSAKAGALRSLIIPGLATLVALAILLSLGTWQVARKAWKEDLIAQVTTRSVAPPQPLPAPATWPELQPADAEFRTVAFEARFDSPRSAFVYGTARATPRAAAEVGVFVFTPAVLADGRIVVVNRGFVPETARAGLRLDDAAGPVRIEGVLRWPEKPNPFSSEPTADLFFVRDHQVVAARQGWGEVAPFYVDQTGPAPAGGLPRPGPPQVNLTNNHLGYALTWYGLAATLVGVFGFYAYYRVRDR